MSHEDHDNRLTKLETTVGNLASNVTALTEAIGKDREAMWNAIENSRTKITWPAIFTAVTVFLGILGCGSKVMDSFVDLKVSNAEKIDALREEYARRDRDRFERTLERLTVERARTSRPGEPLPSAP
jgi:hypothetical protein